MKIKLAIAASVIALLTILFLCIHVWDIPSMGWKKKVSVENPENSCATRETNKTLTLTTNWSENVYLHKGEDLDFHLLTINTWWELMINDEKIYTFSPINPGCAVRDPRKDHSTNDWIDFKEVVGCAKWRICEGMPVDKGKLTYRIYHKS